MVSRRLSAGKTHLVKGIARGGITEQITLTHIHVGVRIRRPLQAGAFGFYRLENDDQILASGLDPYFQPEGITVIEWFNRWARAWRISGT